MKILKTLIVMLISLTLMIPAAVAEVAPPAEAWKLIRRDDTKVIDVRTEEEFKAGALKKAENLSHKEIVAGNIPADWNKDDHYVVYCGSGTRAQLALEALTEKGFKNVTNAGGYSDLKEFRMQKQAGKKKNQ